MALRLLAGVPLPDHPVKCYGTHVCLPSRRSGFDSRHRDVKRSWANRGTAKHSRRRKGRSRVQDDGAGHRFGEWCCDGNKIGAQRAYWRDILKTWTR